MVASGDVARLLSSLVRRSGRDEREIAARAGISLSTLRQYTSGRSIPPTYDPLEHIGIACGALEGDLDGLCESWRNQAHPPVELTYAGFRFRGSLDAVGWHFPGDGFRDQILARAWKELGSPAPVDYLDMTAQSKLRGLVVDALGSRPALRSSVRRALVSDDELQAFNASISDAESFARRFEAPVLEFPVGVRDVLWLGLLHPRSAISAKAAERINGGRGTRDHHVVLTAPEAGAAQDEVRKLADEWVARWVAWGNACGPSDRDLVEDGIRRCYEFSGLRWPGTVIWTDSPYIGALTDRLVRRLVADGQLGLSSRLRPRRSAPRASSSSMLRQDVSMLRQDADIRFCEWMYQGLVPLVGTDLLSSVRHLVGDPVQAELAITENFFRRFPGSGPPPVEFIGPTDPAQVTPALERVAEQLPWRVRVRLSQALEADGGPPHHGIGGTSAVGGHDAAAWLAKFTLVQQVFGTRARGSLWARLDAYRDANAAGPWWASSTAVVISERPVVVNSQLVDTASGPRRLLEAPDGAVVRWGDGIASQVVQGVHVPPDLLRPGWTVERILAERNVEVRRIAMERYGWDRLVAEAGLTPVHGPVPDPGNPGRYLSLVELPPRPPFEDDSCCAPTLPRIATELSADLGCMCQLGSMTPSRPPPGPSTSIAGRMRVSIAPRDPRAEEDSMSIISDPSEVHHSQRHSIHADIDVPLCHGAQRQGDVLVLPIRVDGGRAVPDGATAIPADGVVILRGDTNGNAHRLVGDGTWLPSSAALDLGVVVATEVYLLHPEHGALGIGPGWYRIRRQREHSPAGPHMVAD